MNSFVELAGCQILFREMEIKDCIVTHREDVTLLYAQCGTGS